MKRIFNIFFTLSLFVAMTGFTSCKGGDSDNSDGEGGGKPSGAKIEKVIEKYDEKGELSENDYAILLDYIDAGMDEAVPLAKQIKKAYEDGDTDKMESLQKKAEEIEKKYPHMEKALNIIERTSDEELGDANYKKAKKVLNKINSFYD